MKLIKNKLKNVVIVLMVLVMPISAIIATSLHAKDTTQVVASNYVINRKKNLKASRDNWDDLYQEYDARAVRKEDIEIKNILELGYVMLDMLDDEQDVQLVFDYFISNLSEDIQRELQNIFVSVLGNTQTDTSGQPDKVGVKGWYKTHLVFAMSLGYIAGDLSSSLISILLGIIFGPACLALGPIGVLLAALIATALGAWIGDWLDNVVNSNFGIINGFRYVLCTLSWWWIWGGSEDDLNIMDLLTLLIGGLGGSVGYGYRPDSVKVPSYA
jgi:hypothetical protein